MCALYMALCGVSLYLFWKSPAHSGWNNTLLLMSAGFFVYGPQALIGVAAANLATKRAAATAVGLTGVFGYISTVLSGWGLGTLVQHDGWDAAFKCLLAVAGVGTFLFLLAWPAKANGYREAATA
jgi:OPA family glycerol-3-phosphate transporter-like MFS transporter/OPA family sugar phosphate sensor protein UhpC-like MFS transporter